MNQSTKNVRFLTRLAMLLAVLLVMYFTPLGMLPTPGQYVTLLTVPVAVGAMLLGPLAGGILGFAFGMLSFWRAFQTGTLIAVGVQPPAIFVLCVVTRTLMGVCVGWLYRLLDKIDRTHTVSYFVGGFAAPALNTVFYMTVYVHILLRTEQLQNMLASTLGDGIIETLRQNIFLFVAAYVGIQAVLEAVVGCIVSGLVCKALHTVFAKALK